MVPFASTEYEEIVEALLPPAGPVSEANAAIRSKRNREQTRFLVRINYDRPQRAVRPNWKYVNVVGCTLTDDQEAAVGTESQ